jgi:uncharacterized protein (AIM24 family)
MKYNTLYRPVYSLLEVELQQGESIRAEGDVMVTMTPTIEIQTSARGGILSSLKRPMLGGESFFQNTYTARKAEA